MSSAPVGSDECISEEAGRLGFSFVVITAISLVLTPILIISGGILWWKNRKNVYLIRRNPTLVAMSVIPFVAYTMSAHAYRISLEKNLIFAQCGESNFAFVFVIFSLLIPNTCRIICFHFRVEYHKTLTKVSASGEDERSKTSNLGISSQASSKRLGNAASKANAWYTIRIAIIMFVVAALLSFGYVVYSCPIALLGTHTCNFGFTNDPLILMFAIPFLPQVALNFYFGRLVKEAPDPFNIKKEIDVFNILIMIGLAFIVLDGIDPGNLAKRNSDDKIYFRYVVFCDIIMFIAFVNGVHYQIYKASKMKGTVSLRIPVGFAEVLSNKAAHGLFRSFLQSEFSVENLVAYELMAGWKARYHESINELRMNEAKNIFRVWIDPNSESAIGLNIGYLAVQELANDLEKLRTYPETLFDNVIADLYSLMRNDSFMRFTYSNDYKTFVGLSDPGTFILDEI